MKLNYKRTFCVGFAFFLICAFWQAYDTIIPKILTDKFGLSQTWSGVVMAIDNILALFMLPLFGAISDKCNSKRGKRTPFIVVGTLVAAIAFMGLSVIDNMQLTNISEITGVATDNPAAYEVLYDYDYNTALKTPDGVEFNIKEDFTREEYTAITTSSVDENGENLYTNYVVPARQAYAWDVTINSPVTLYFFMGLLLIILIAMATFRSPAVALMPDVTMKPLRSKANAVINLMGSAGGVIVLGLGIVLGTSKAANAMMNYFLFFGLIAAIMLVSLVIFLITVKEPKFVKEMHEESRKYGIEEDIGVSNESSIEKKRLSKAELRSLIFILASVVFWFFGYNAITSKYSVYASSVLLVDYNTTLIVAQAAAIAAYFPVGLIASKVGRKKTIMAGVIMLTVAFGAAYFIKAGSSVLIMNLLFALAGIAWATINVNSFPMVVELSKAGDVGKYTGFYYTASMAAQVLTPIISGMLMDVFGMKVLFPYGAAFVFLALITMLFVKHGDSKPIAKKGVEALDADD